MKTITNNFFKISLSIFLVLVSGSYFSQTISTVAGTGTAGFSGNGGLATAADLNIPTNTAIDGAGNLYIVEMFNHAIRKVDATTGVISTVAGTGTGGFSGDGGPATSAKLNHPSGIALDAMGNIYIADAFNHRIRRVSVATGNISTVVGTGVSGSSGDGALATVAKLNIPAGIAFDATGNYFIADQDNNKIRKVNISTGNISTVAGVGTAGFSGDGGLATAAELTKPAAIELDAAGNLYIADFSNHRIRKVDASTGNISTIAGVGTAGFSGDGGLATAAELNNPVGISIDPTGNFYVADNSNHRIRKIDKTTGVINTIAGTGTASYSGDGGLPTAADLNYPYEIAFDAAGDFYIPDAFNHRIRKVTICTPNAGTDTRTECNPFVWIDGNTYTANNNTATHVLTNAGGCDSTVTLDLTITDVDVSVSQQGNEFLSADEMVASYQWLDCNENYAVLPGETARTFYTLSDGSYAVEVTYYGCKDTSACYTVSTAGVEEINNTAMIYTAYPNPTTDQFTISANGSQNKELSYQLYDLTGKVLKKGSIINGEVVISTSTLDKALYFIKIKENKTLVKTIKMIKN